MRNSRNVKDKDGLPGRLVFFAIMSGLLAAVLLYDPRGGPATCTSRVLFGLPCPGCGMTRSVTAMARGRLAESLEVHLFGPLVLAVMSAVWGISLAGLLRGRGFRLPGTPAFNVTLVVTLVLLLGYWAARMATGTLP